MKKTKTSFVSLAFISLASVLLATSAVGCGRAHLGTQFAQSYTAWFGAQATKPKTSPEETRKVIERLDAMEAGAVSKSYRKTVGKGDEAAFTRMLTVGAPRGGSEGYIPPPSVP